MPFDGGAPHLGKPEGRWELDRGFALARGLAFLFPLFEGGGDARDLVTGTVLARVGATAWTRSVPGAITDGDGTNGHFRVGSGYTPIVTSDGVGAGDFTMVALVNAAAVASAQYVISQRQSGSAQANLAVNASQSGGSTTASSGRLSFATNAGAGFTQASALSIIDGTWRWIAGRRSGSTLTVWSGPLTGVMSNLASATASHDIQNASQGFGLGCAGNSATTFPYPDGLALAAGWNRALDDDEMRDVPWIIWHLLAPPADWGAPAFKAPGGGTTVPQAASASATATATNARRTAKGIAVAQSLAPSTRRAVAKRIDGASASVLAIAKRIGKSAGLAAGTVASAVAALLGGIVTRPASALPADAPATVCAAADRAATSASPEDAAATLLATGDSAAA